MPKWLGVLMPSSEPEAVLGVLRIHELSGSQVPVMLEPLMSSYLILGEA